MFLSVSIKMAFFRVKFWGVFEFFKKNVYFRAKFWAVFSFDEKTSFFDLNALQECGGRRAEEPRSVSVGPRQSPRANKTFFFFSWPAVYPLLYRPNVPFKGTAGGGIFFFSLLLGHFRHKKVFFCKIWGCFLVFRSKWHFFG